MAEQLISTAVHHTLPDSYVRSEAERPRLDEVVPDADIPVVDLANPDRAAVIAQIGAACSSHGFFQVLNHGLPLEVMLAAMAVAHEFFRLSPEEKAKLYSDDPAKMMHLSTSYNWRDFLRLHCHPLEQFVPEWPANPPPFRDVMSTYCKEVRELGFRLYAATSESLGMGQDYIRKVLGEQEQHMAVNFYPKCPSPELTYGLPAHTDPNALTIPMMDKQVAGLQVLKEGRWIAVNPRPNALVINLGDQLQVVTVKLTRDTHLLWKAQIVPIMRGHQLMGYLDGTIAAPPEMVPASAEDGAELVVNTAYTNWYVQDQLILAAVLSTLSPDILSRVIGLTSSAVVWAALERMFANQSRTWVTQIRRQLAMLQKKNLSVSDYFGQAKALGDQLASVGQPLRDEELILHMLTGLDGSYDVFVTSINLKRDGMTVDEFYSHLLDNEASRDANHTNFQITTNLALHGNSNGGGSGFKKGSSSRTQ